MCSFKGVKGRFTSIWVADAVESHASNELGSACEDYVLAILKSKPIELADPETREDQEDCDGVSCWTLGEIFPHCKDPEGL